MLFPVEGPRPEIAPDDAAYRWLVGVDDSANSLPSLHAGLSVYSLLYGYAVLRDGLGPGVRALYVGASLLGAGAILYATLATKQHWLVDLPLGMLVAWVAHRAAWRGVGAGDREEAQLTPA